MKKLLYVFAAVMTACTTPQTSETVQDSTAIVDSLELEEVNNETHEAVDADTALMSEIKSKFTKEQINPKVAYQYRKGGLLVFASPNDTVQPVEVIPYGTKIMLAENLVNSRPSDNVIVDGLKGRYIKLDGAEKYVFSGYLTNFPMPADDEGFVDYCKNHFNLGAIPVKITSKVMYDGNYPEWTKEAYKFEAEIEVEDNAYYEGASTAVRLPASCTLQEGFLLLKSFASTSLFDSAFYSFPNGAYTRDLKRQFTKANVDANENGVTRIYVSDEGGCYDEIYVEKIDGRIVIGSGGGC